MNFLSKLFRKKQREIAPSDNKQGQSKETEVYSESKETEYSVRLINFNDLIIAIKELKSIGITVEEAMNIIDAHSPHDLIKTSNKHEIIQLREKLKTCELIVIEEDGRVLTSSWDKDERITLTEMELSTLFPIEDWVEPSNIQNEITP